MSAGRWEAVSPERRSWSSFLSEQTIRSARLPQAEERRVGCDGRGHSINLCHNLATRPKSRDRSLAQDKQVVRLSQNAWAMCDDENRRSAGLQMRDRLDQRFLALEIETGVRLVE